VALTTTTKQPTVYLMIGGSAITRDERGELIETVTCDKKGRPVWEEGGICDGRGTGGPEGYRALVRAMDEAEANANLLGFTGHNFHRIP
jgi:hypothetical protein